MTDEELKITLEKFIKNGNCFSIEVRNILMTYKNANGTKENAQKLIEQLAIEFSSNDDLQDNVYDILDIVTGWCTPEMRVW